MAKNHPRICANCKHWICFDVDYGDFPEDECGSCKKHNGEVVFGDSESCEDFKQASGRGRARKNY